MTNSTPEFDDGFDYDAVNEIAAEVTHERLDQHEQWGRQEHASSYSAANNRSYAREADRWRQINAARAKAGSLTWDGILLKEVFEACAEADPARRREELIQVAAVAMAEIECLDRAAEPQDTEPETQTLSEAA